MAVEMALELHIWGAALGLPSIDAECLAAVAYFAAVLPGGAWSLVESSPSAVPTRVSHVRVSQASH